MAGFNSMIYERLNALSAAYFHNPEMDPDYLLAQVHNVAERTLHDDDRAQEFAIMTWQSLPLLRDLPWAFGGWFWRRLRWRRIDYRRAGQSLIAHEVQASALMDEDGELLSVEGTLDLLAYLPVQSIFAERAGKLESISDPFVRRVAEHLLAGYTQTEVATRLGVNASTLRSRLSPFRRSNKPPPG